MLLSALTFQSCELDLSPENTLTYTNAFTTEAELATTTASIHFFLSTAFGNNATIMAAGSKLDELTEMSDVRNWNPQMVARSDNDWKSLYDIIFESNLLLDNIHRTKDLPENRYNYHTGQAQFALGLCYLALAQRYSSAIITEDSKTIKMYSNVPQAEVLDEAIKHAEKAYQLLPTLSNMTDLKGAPTNCRQYASKGAAATLLANIYAWRGSLKDLYGKGENSAEDYKKAVDYAGEVINGKTGNYRLCASAEELCQYLSDADKENPETIFALVFDYTRSSYTTSPNSPGLSYVGWPVDRTKQEGDIEIDNSFRLYKETVLDMYPDENDERKAAFFYEIDKDHMSGDHNYAVLYKFREPINDPDQTAEHGFYFRTIKSDYTYWRLADLLLLRAECNNKLNNTAAAMVDLNLVRSRAKAAAYPANGENDLKKAIFKERERELIAENDGRYYDIIRNGYVKTELQGKFPLLTKSDIANGALFLPIPTSAFKSNEGIVINTQIQQSPYWLPYM